jgi:hypothetical protein
LTEELGALTVPGAVDGIAGTLERRRHLLAQGLLHPQRPEFADTFLHINLTGSNLNAGNGAFTSGSGCNR